MTSNNNRIFREKSRKTISQDNCSPKRIALSLKEDQVKLLHSLKGFGKKDSEIVKNILADYLSRRER